MSLENLALKLAGRIKKLDTALERLEAIVLVPYEGDTPERDSIAFKSLQDEYERLLKIQIMAVDTLRKAAAAVEKSTTDFATDELYLLLKSKTPQELKSLRDTLLYGQSSRITYSDQQAAENGNKKGKTNKGNRSNRPVVNKPVLRRRGFKLSL